MRPASKEYNFEIRLANGNSRKFETGSDMYNWAMKMSPRMKFDYDEKTTPDLSEWFEQRWSKSSK